LENKEGVDTGSNKYDHSDDSGSCVVTSDSGSKLDCPAEDRKSKSDELCPLKRRKTKENCGPKESENEGPSSTIVVAVDD